MAVSLRTDRYFDLPIFSFHVTNVILKFDVLSLLQLYHLVMESTGYVLVSNNRKY